MPLKIENQKKELTIDIDGSILKYHLIPYVERQRIVMEHVVNGEFDPFKVALALLEIMVFDWENVIGDDDKPIKYEPSYLQFLDGNAILELIDKVIAPSLKGIIELKKDLVKKGKIENKDNREKAESAEDDLKN